MYWFGQKREDQELLEEKNWSLLSKRRELASTPMEKILSLLDAFSEESFSDALPELIKESGFSEEETKKTLSLLPTLLNRENLEKRLKAEFTRPEVLDKFIKLPHAQFKTRATPYGLLLHVTAGNVFLSSIDSLIMGFLTKNLSILKVSSSNKFFPLYFAEKLKTFDKEKILSDKFSVVHWKGGDTKIENFVKNKVSAIIGWGGEEMIESYRRNLPSHVKFLDFGPKISLQVITRNSLLNKEITLIADHIVQDIIPWDQSACASPQNLYLQEGVDEELFLNALETAFEKACPRGSIDEDEATEILKEKYRGLWSELMGEGKIFEGKESLLHLEQNRHLRPSPLHRSLIVKRFRNEEELFSLLEPFSYYLQSCSYLFHESEKESYLNLLSLTGIKRFAPLGTITWGMEGAPHDGRFVLRELVQFVGDEHRIQNYGETVNEIHNSSTIKKHFETTPHPRGYIFSSGGTTGEPKFVHFSYEEFDYMTDMLAQNLVAQGVRRGMTVANLFVAGNLWSSFLGVEKALEKIGVVQLPIGGLCSNDNVHFYLKKFRPDVVMGIPSMLVMNAEYSLKQNEDFEVPMIFYAGEALSQVRKEFLEKTWKTKYFGSAGYASVDAGVIGFQCSRCGPGEHHVFSDFIDLKIVNDEAVVTSFARNTMPVENYRTGDKIEWIPDCSCGRTEKRFKLLGRIDSVIQVWSCRLLTTDIEKCLAEQSVITFQIQISEVLQEETVTEKVSIHYEETPHAIDHEKLLLNIYEASRDVKDTIDFLLFKKNVSLIPTKKISRNERTGKVSLILDSRR